MATSRDSPPSPPSKKSSVSTTSPKRVSFSVDSPEIIPSPKSRRASSTTQRPSWSSVFLLRESRSKNQEDPVARSRSLSPGPSILKEFSSYASDAPDSELRKDQHGNEPKVHISPLWEKNLKRLPRGRKKKIGPLPIPQAKVSQVSRRTMSPEDASPKAISPLNPRHASPREDSPERCTSMHHSIPSTIVHPPSPPESSDSEEEDEDYSDISPNGSRNSSVDEDNNDDDNNNNGKENEEEDDEDVELVMNKFRTATIDEPQRLHNQQNQRGRDEAPSAKKELERPGQTRRRSLSVDAAEKWMRKSSIYEIRSTNVPRVPKSLRTMRV